MMMHMMLLNLTCVKWGCLFHIPANRNQTHRHRGMIGGTALNSILPSIFEATIPEVVIKHFHFESNRENAHHDQFGS